jgi:hypothetical protein
MSIHHIISAVTFCITCHLLPPLHDSRPFAKQAARMRAAAALVVAICLSACWPALAQNATNNNGTEQLLIVFGDSLSDTGKEHVGVRRCDMQVVAGMQWHQHSMDTIRPVISGQTNGHRPWYVKAWLLGSCFTLAVVGSHHPS